MAQTYSGSIKIGGGLKVEAPVPIDDKTVVPTTADLITIPNQYVGLISTPEDTGIPHVRVSAGWVPIGTEIIFDSSPTNGSLNAVTSDGIYDALQTKADLVGGIVPAYQLPGYVDAIANGEYIDSTTFNDLDDEPYSPLSNVLYVDVNTNLVYRWSGIIYVPISSALALGETSSTAYRGDRGKTAYDHSQIVDGTNPHATEHTNLVDILGSGEYHVSEEEQEYLTTITANDDVGNLYDIVNLLATPPTYTPPTSSITNVTNTYEIGTSQSLNITQTFNQNDAGAKTSETITKNGTTVDTDSSYAEVLVIPSGSTLYAGTVSYAQGDCLDNNIGIQDCNGRIESGTVASPTRTITGIYPVFSFKSSSPITAASMVTAIEAGDATKYVIQSTGTIAVNYAPNAQYVGVAYVATSTTKTKWSVSLLDQGNIPGGVFGSATTLSVDSPDGYWENINYKIHVTPLITNPAAPTIQLLNS